MVRINIDVVPMVKDTHIVGLITHRDVLLDGSEAMGLKVEDLLTKDLFTVYKETIMKEIS